MEFVSLERELLFFFCCSCCRPLFLLIRDLLRPASTCLSIMFFTVFFKVYFRIFFPLAISIIFCAA